jgi:hypothetical protein
VLCIAGSATCFGGGGRCTAQCFVCLGPVVCVQQQPRRCLWSALLAAPSEPHPPHLPPPPFTHTSSPPPQVSSPDVQHKVMIEGVENHMPEVIIIDEIGTELECLAARTIAQRGVQLVATAHGNELENVIKNPALADLVGGWRGGLWCGWVMLAGVLAGLLAVVLCGWQQGSCARCLALPCDSICSWCGHAYGACDAMPVKPLVRPAGDSSLPYAHTPQVGGIQSVTLGDEEAKRRGVQKSILERAGPPTFDVAVEMLERHKWRVHVDVAHAVDVILAGGCCCWPAGHLHICTWAMLGLRQPC